MSEEKKHTGYYHEFINAKPEDCANFNISIKEAIDRLIEWDRIKNEQPQNA